MKAPYKAADFELAPEGNHVSRLYSIVDIGVQKSQYGEKRQVIMTYELCNELMKDGRPFVVSKFYTLSLHESSNLCIDIEGIVGKKIPDDVKQTFDFRKMLGLPCMLHVVHEDGKENKKRASVKSIASVPKGLVAPPLVNPAIFFDLDEPDWNLFETLPDWLRKKINKEGYSYVSPSSSAPADAPQSDDEKIPF